MCAGCDCLDGLVDIDIFHRDELTWISSCLHLYPSSSCAFLFILATLSLRCNDRQSRSTFSRAILTSISHLSPCLMSFSTYQNHFVITRVKDSYMIRV
jgi:hypothetical protein